MKSLRLLGKLRPSVRQIHLVAMSVQIRTPDSTATPTDGGDRASGVVVLADATELRFRKIVGEDDSDLDSVAAVDEWRTSRSVAVDRIRQGHHCHVAKAGDAVIAVTWSTGSARYSDDYLGRDLVMAEHETYGWGTHCVPAYRGHNVIPRLLDFANADLAANHGKTILIGLIRSNNLRMQRSITKLGGIRIGRLGFFQLYNLRLHYLVGRAFPEVRRRTYLQRLTIGKDRPTTTDR